MKHSFFIIFTFLNCLTGHLSAASQKAKEKAILMNLDKASVVRLEKQCPKDLAHSILTADLVNDYATIPDWMKLIENSHLDCQVPAMVVLSQRIHQDSYSILNQNFFYILAVNGRRYPTETLPSFQNTYLRILPTESTAQFYFMGLAELKFDLREHLFGQIKEDWKKDSGRFDALTWLYYGYRANMGELSALDTIERHIAEIKSTPEDVLSELRDLFYLRKHANVKIKEKVNKIIDSYRNSQWRLSPPCYDPMPGSPPRKEELGRTLGEALKMELDE